MDFLRSLILYFVSHLRVFLPWFFSPIPHDHGASPPTFKFMRKTTSHVISCLIRSCLDEYLGRDFGSENLMCRTFCARSTTTLLQTTHTSFLRVTNPRFPHCSSRFDIQKREGASRMPWGVCGFRCSSAALEQSICILRMCMHLWSWNQQQPEFFFFFFEMTTTREERCTCASLRQPFCTLPSMHCCTSEFGAYACIV